jgi:hypothetical protein
METTIYTDFDGVVGSSDFMPRAGLCKPPLGKTTLRLLQEQRGRCPLCLGLLLYADHEAQSPKEWEQ